MAFRKMRILYISNFSTTACRTGAEWRSYWLRNSLEAIASVETVELTSRNLERSVRFRYIWTIILRKFCSQMTFPYYFKAFKERIVGNKKFDAIVVRYSSIAAALGIWELGVPCYVDIDDLPSQLCKTKFLKFICGVWQKWLYSKMAGCWIANRDQVPVVAPYTKCIALPNIANPPRGNVLVAGRQPILLTVGSLTHLPNVDGIDRFVAHDWRRTVAACPTAEYWIAGGGCPEDKRNEWLRIKGVKVLGFVEDLCGLYSVAKAVVCPVYSGGGTCIKTVEAVMHGKVCIGPEFAFRGWTATQKDNPFIKIANGELATASIEVLMNSPPSPLPISEWARENFGDGVFKAAVKRLFCDCLCENIR